MDTRIPKVDFEMPLGVCLTGWNPTKQSKNKIKRESFLSNIGCKYSSKNKGNQYDISII